MVKGRKKKKHQKNLLRSLQCIFKTENKKKQQQSQVQHCATNRNKADIFFGGGGGLGLESHVHQVHCE